MFHKLSEEVRRDRIGDNEKNVGCFLSKFGTVVKFGLSLRRWLISLLAMTTIGTPFTSTAKKALLCGSGELGKEVAIELQRYGVEVIALDAYADAPAMQVADRSHVVSMLDGAALRAIIESEKPDIVIPEVEAIATDTLAELEQERVATIIPTARATQLTMNREGIRRLAAEGLGLLTSPFQFAGTFEDYSAAIREIGMPCVIKPIMSSSGKGQSVVKTEADIETSWNYAQEGGRAGKGKVIIEGFVDFDYEITLLTVRHVDGTSFCDPIGHIQVDGDYRESWQPHPMSETALNNAQHIAKSVTDSLGGFGIFGVELFVKGDLVYFSEVSPRPHDTGMVTIVSQDLPQFALHARAILGLPIPAIRQLGPSASAVILVEGHSESVAFGNLENALREPDTQLRLFGKPKVAGKRRMGVALARADDIETARAKARKVSAAVEVSL
jgi:phosphoribosylglycinamide formyltransferase 2